MANLEFKVIGINNIIDDTNEKFVCSVSDGKSIYLGSERTDTTGNIWKYTKGSWSKITSNLADYQFPLKSITSLLLKKGTLFASTGGSFEDFGLGQLWYNNNGRWISTGVASNNFSTIRKIVKIQDDIYAAGSVIDVKKYSNGSWSSQLFPQDPSWGALSDLVNHFWLDLETDGTNLFAIPFSQLKTPIRGIWQYDGATWTEISDPQLLDTDNKAIIKLCWYSGKLYAATYNEETGTQIHKRTAGVWSQINTNGFGTRNNYSTACMKVVAGNLVVTTENNEGSEVWIYNEVDDWEQHTVNSEVLYLSYLVESTDIDNFLIGTTPIRLISNDPAVQYISPQERAFRDVHFWPEGSMGAIPIGLDKYRFLAANNKRTLISEGPATDPLEYIHSNNELHTNELLVSAYPSPAGVVSNLATTSITFGEAPQESVFIERFNFDRDETNAHLPFSSIEYWTLNLVASLTPDRVVYPKKFNAVHMNLIPKGKNRGKVMVMDDSILAGRSPAFTPSSHTWSLQPWCIVDPSPDAGTPEKPRFLNYILPIAPCSAADFNDFRNGAGNGIGQVIQNPTTSWSAFPNLFCAGHSWDHNGNLILAGGTTWCFISGLSNISIPGVLNIGDPIEGADFFGDRRTYVWNPAHPSGSWMSGNHLGYNVQKYTNQGHYASAGAWVRGPDLTGYRWYPTITYHPKITRTSNYAHAMVFGGDRAGIIIEAPPGHSRPEYNNYESLVISGGFTVSNSGLYKDTSAGNPLFKGPAAVTAEYFSASGYNPYPTIQLSATPSQRGDFYFYPRTYLLSGGGITFAGMLDESSLLISHDAAPGVWSATLGGTRSGDPYDPGNTKWDRWRLYGSAVRMPNVGNNVDRIARIGGSDPMISGRWAYEEELTTETNSMEILDASVSTNQWQTSSPMNSARSNFNTVLLPDATILAFGGLEALNQYNSFRQSFVESPSSISSLDEFMAINNLILFYDHHRTGGIASFNFGDVTDEEEDHLVHMVEDFEEIYEFTPPESQGNPSNLPVGGVLYHLFPEIFEEGVGWTEYNWAPHHSYRPYHSTALLLPDGRVLLGGGDLRHSTGGGANAYALSSGGYDFEIFYPKYLRPTQDGIDRYPRPTGVGISGATYNSDPEVDCFELNYGTEYILSSNFIRSDVALEKVVFMSPGSVTHHADVTQRYYACSSVVVSDTQLRFRLPTNIFELPPGFYMVFAVTDQKVPAEAIWIKLLKP